MLFPSLSCQENHGWSCWHCSQVVTACDLPFIHPGRTSSGCAWEACPTDPWPKEDEGHGGYKTDRTQRSMMIHDLWDLEFRRFWIFSLAMLSTCRWPQILCEVLCVSVCVCQWHGAVTLGAGQRVLAWWPGVENTCRHRCLTRFRHQMPLHSIVCIEKDHWTAEIHSSMSAMSESAVVSRVSGIAGTAGTAGTPYVLSLSISIYHSGSLGQSEPCQCLLECRRPARRHPWTSAKAQHSKKMDYTWIQYHTMLMSIICDEIMWYARLRFK